MNTGNNKNENEEKNYFTIGQISTMLDIKPTILRFWEQEFEELKPIKNKFGHRVYTDSDIDIIKKIKDLLYGKGLTIKGAKSLLKSQCKIRNSSDIKTKLTEILDILKGSTMSTTKEIIKKLNESNNSHVMYFFEQLNKLDKDEFIKELQQIDFNKIESFYNEYKNFKKQAIYIDPTEYYPLTMSKNNIEIKQIGIKSLIKGEVAFLTVAGGQGSRLGYEHPKGCFPISPVKNKSLFQIFADKILFYTRHYNNDFYWYIMTSKQNNEETKSFFIDNNYFGLDKEHILFFIQGQLPTLTLEGKLILKDKKSLFLNPDGHGGTLNALLKNNLIDHMIKNGIKYISYFQVDNPLIKMADPYFIGYHIKEQSLVSSKVIKKTYPEEKLGAIGKINGINSVIEYSDLSTEDLNAKDQNGILKYLMGSIAIHIFNVDFLLNFTDKMPIHFAIKNVNGYSFDNPERPEIKDFKGLKFESFIFDIIPMASKSVFFETAREEEFFPLKNKEGIDSIETCVKGQSMLFHKWLKDAKFTQNNYNDEKIEISPLYAPDYEIFLSKSAKDNDKIIKAIFNKDRKFKNEIYIE
ncbi:MAG: UTP--glucose-1-phosphate uridylyltransferase [Spirochaetes bacterium]|nr:UTP--glucose-1-phosphate uridylyltransferase [Spirochaetota bacterium]